MRKPAGIIIVGIVASMVLAAPALALPSIPSQAFQSAQGCGCHSAFQVSWSRSMHANALSDPIYQYELGLALRATDGAIGPFCNSCHGPIAVMAGEIDGLDLSKTTAVGREGVTCDFCHQMTGRAEGRVGNYSYLLASPDGTKRAQYDDSKSPVHETAFSAFHTTAELCGTCHDVYHPANGLPLEATYTEWKNGPYAAEGIVCQDCHMTPGPGVVKPYPGKAAAFGPDRDHIYLMTWAGGNVALGLSELAEERLQAAATIDIKAPQYIEPGTTGDVKVTVTNSGAGHYLPTGLTNVRQMWLEVKAIDSEDRVVFEDVHRYGTEFADATGKSPVEVWDAVSIAKDDRIPPQESRSYDFQVPMSETGALTFDATLYYRSCSEEIAEKAKVEVGTTTMVSAQAPIYGSKDAAVDAIREADKASREADTIGGFNTLAVVVFTFLAVGGIITITAMRHLRSAKPMP